MTSMQLDSLITDLLESVFTISRFRTCLCVRLSDYAAQICGYRSTRCMDESGCNTVDEKYTELLCSAYDYVHEMLERIKKPHTYQQSMYEMTECEIECLLEDTLYNAVCFSCDINVIIN